MFIRDNPLRDGAALVEAWHKVYGGGEDRFSNAMRQFEKEGLIEFVPEDGTPHIGGILSDPRPHIWQLTDDGRGFLKGSPS